MPSIPCVLCAVENPGDGGSRPGARPPAKQQESPRPLPWSSLEGKPCHLVTDENGGPVSRPADATETVQLGMGGAPLVHAHDMLPDALPGELRFLAERLAEALHDALRVAESRGRRLSHLD